MKCFKLANLTRARDLIEKSAFGQRSTPKKHVTSTSCRLGPAIWSRDTGQQIPCLDRCQLLITWMFNIKEVHRKPRLHLCTYLLFGVWPPCCATPSPAVVRTRPRAIPLPMTTMRKSVHGFHFPYMVMGLRLAYLRAAGAPLLYYTNKFQLCLFVVSFHFVVCAT